jgi:hypothetical protein
MFPRIGRTALFLPLLQRVAGARSIDNTTVTPREFSVPRVVSDSGASSCSRRALSYSALFYRVVTLTHDYARRTGPLEVF